MEKEKYFYKHLPISGGGYVTGLQFGKKNNRLYARTDIGGVFKYEREKRSWKPLMIGVNPDTLALAFPLAIELDEEAEELLLAAGNRGEDEGVFASAAFGETKFCVSKIPAKIHGNNPGRGSGKRLVLSEGVLWFASQSEGLLKSTDRGKSWTKTSCPETNTTFVFVWNRIVVVGCSGKAEAEYGEEIKRGHPLYYSNDGGESFNKLPCSEYPKEQPGMQGFVPYRYAWDGQNLYITLFGTGEVPGYFGLDAYGTDSVHNLICGRVIRYSFKDGDFSGYTDVTPDEKTFDIINKSGIKPEKSCYSLAFGGIDASVSKPGLMILGLTAGVFGSAVLRSFDYGESWEIVLHGLSIGEFEPQTPYLKPVNNNGENCAHWLNDLKINPQDENEAWYVTGTGTFCTGNFTEKTVRWTDNCDGLEETVHMNVYSLPYEKKSEDDIYVVDAVGDIGAFIFRKTDKKCDSQVMDENRHTYITVLNADYAERIPSNILLTPRGNWRGSSKGGVVYSEDYGRTFIRLMPPRGFGEFTDELIDRIEKPNVNSGWCAISSDSKTIVWGMCEGQNLPADAVFVTDDKGTSWDKAVVDTLVYPRAEKNYSHVRPEGYPAWMKWPLRCPDQIKIFADRVDPELFFGFGDNFRIYVSTDRARHFRELRVDESVPLFPLAIAEAPIGQIRGESGKSGSFWIAAGKEGLWHMQYDRLEDNISLKKIDDVEANTVGLGVSRNGDKQNTLFISGKIKGEYGFYRSEDFGESWVIISDDRQCFGQIRSIDGDYAQFGRFFIASGTMGIIMGAKVTER